MNYKIKRESYCKETPTNLLIKAKVDCVQKTARPATRRSQLSTEHFPWRPQLKLACINQWRVHPSVHQSWESQCLQTGKYGYNTIWGMPIRKRAEVSSRCQGSWKPHRTVTLIPRKRIHIKRMWVQRLGLLWEKNSKLSSPLCQSC